MGSLFAGLSTGLTVQDQVLAACNIVMEHPRVVIVIFFWPRPHLC